MSKAETAEQIYSRLGIQDKSVQSTFKQTVSEFLNEQLKTDDALSVLELSNIGEYANKFLDSEAGAQCLTRSCGNESWCQPRSYLAVTKKHLEKLVTLWVKNKKTQNRRKTNSSNAIDASSNSDLLKPSNPAASAAGASKSSASVSRLLPTALEQGEGVDDPDFHQDRDIISESNTDDLPSPSKWIEKGKRRETAVADPSPLWSANTELDRAQREFTVDSEAPTERDLTSRAPTPATKDHGGLPSPPATKLRHVRARDEDLIDHSPAAERHVAKRVRLNLGDNRQKQQPSSREEIAAHVERVSDGSASRSRSQAPAILTVSNSEVQQSSRAVDTVVPEVANPPKCCITISSQEAEFSSDNLAKIPPIILSYIRRCEHQMLRKCNREILDRGRRRELQERSRLLHQLIADIESRILNISHQSSDPSRLKRERSDPEDEEPAISSYVLWEYS